MHLGRLDDAARELAEAARLAPGDAGVRFDFGGALQRLGRREAALAEFGAAARVQPSHAAAWGALGLTAAQLGRQRESIAFWERAQLLDSTYFAGRIEESAPWKAILSAVGRQPPADTAALPNPQRHE